MKHPGDDGYSFPCGPVISPEDKDEDPDHLVLDKLDQLIRILEALLAKVEILIQVMRERR